MTQFRINKDFQKSGKRYRERTGIHDSDEEDLTNLITLKRNLTNKNPYNLKWVNESNDVINLRTKHLRNLSMTDLNDKKTE